MKSSSKKSKSLAKGNRKAAQKKRAPKTHVAKSRVARPRAAKSALKSRPARVPAQDSLPSKKPPASVAGFPASLALYVYGITEAPGEPFAVSAEAVDGKGSVEPMSADGYLCWASRVSRQEFAADLQKNMENLEWLAACSIRHQKVLSEIGAVTQVLPARFGTVFLSPETLIADFREKLPGLRAVFQRISEADEWGVKIFGTPQPRSTAVVNASSGADYLRQKSAALQSSATSRHDEAITKFGEELAKLSAASVAGGKASSGQPGLIWSASFLVKRARKKKFDDVLRRYAADWAGTRRIDISGPWPPYSFVSESQ